MAAQGAMGINPGATEPSIWAHRPPGRGSFRAGSRREEPRQRTLGLSWDDISGTDNGRARRSLAGCSATPVAAPGRAA
jgi:hypothetical protein